LRLHRRYDENRNLTTAAPDKMKATSRKMKLFYKRASRPHGMLKPTR